MAAISHPAVWAKLKLQKASERWQPDTEVGENGRVFGVASHDRKEGKEGLLQEQI